MNVPLWLSLSVAACIAAVWSPAVLAQEIPGKAEVTLDSDNPWMIKMIKPLERLQRGSFESKTLGKPCGYLVYLPPDYDKQTTSRYPVIYWLHGIGGSPGVCKATVDALDAAIRANKMPPVILVSCTHPKRAQGGWLDGPDVPVETVIIRELIPHIDKTHRTITGREGRAVEGFSAGGRD